MCVCGGEQWYLNQEQGKNRSERQWWKVKDQGKTPEKSRAVVWKTVGAEVVTGAEDVLSQGPAFPSAMPAVLPSVPSLPTEEQDVWALGLCPVSELPPAETEASSRGLYTVLRPDLALTLGTRSPHRGFRAIRGN